MTALRRIGMLLVILVVLTLGLVWSLPSIAKLGLRLAVGDDITVERLTIGLYQTRIEHLVFGAAAEQRIGELLIDYAPGRLLYGEIDRIGIDGLSLRANLDTDGFRLLGEPPGPEQSEGVALPSSLAPKAVTISNSTVELETALGLVTLPLSGRIETEDEGLHFEVESRTAGLRPSANARSDAGFGLDKGAIDVDVVIEGTWPFTDAPSWEHLTASGYLDLILRDATARDVARGLSGGGRIGLDLDKGILTVGSDTLELTGDGPALGGPNLDGPWEATLGRSDAPIGIVGRGLNGGWHFSLDGPATLASANGSATAELAADVTLDDRYQIGRIDRAEASLEIADVAFEEAALKSGRVDLMIEGLPNSLQGKLGLALNGLGWSSPDLLVQGMAVERTFDVAVEDHVLSLVPAIEGKKISIDRLAIGEDLETGWFTIPWRASQQPWLRIDFAKGHFEERIDAEIDPVRIDTRSGRIWARIEDLNAVFAGTFSGLEDGHIGIKRGRIDLPEANLALVGIESDIPFDADGMVKDQAMPLTIRLLRSLDKPHWFVPLRLDTTVRSSGTEITFHGRGLTKTRPEVSIELEGRHDTTKSEGSLDIKLPPFAFASGGLQPGDLSPPLDGILDEAVGSLALDGRIGWNSDDLSGNLALLVEELGLTIGPARLERINSVIHFDDVEPLTTPPDQLLSIALLDVGLPLTDGLVKLQLRGDGQLAVDQLAWRLADGRIRADPFTFGSDVQDLTMVLNAESLDLNALLGLTALDGLGGEGRIDGALPLTIGEAAAAISKGELAAVEPGILRYRPDETPGVLQAGGESVRLMLQALENFHYDALRITLDGKTDGATDIGLHLKGANPELYDGHPLEFNLNLEGNLASLIQTNLENYQIPDRVRERLQGFGR